MTTFDKTCLLNVSILLCRKRKKQKQNKTKVIMIARNLIDFCLTALKWFQKCSWAWITLRWSNDVQTDVCAHRRFTCDLTDKKEYKNEMRWKTKWLHSSGERSISLADTSTHKSSSLSSHDPLNDACVKCNSWGSLSEVLAWCGFAPSL